MHQELFSLLADLHKRNVRQGPGSEVASLRALELSGIDREAALRIADIGCGTGASSMLLARATRAHITAVDFLPEFLDVLRENAEREGVRDRIETLSADMGALPFEKATLDVLWAEGAIYNIGFSRGIREWKEFLKPGGVMVLTEITWLRRDVPEELSAHWASEYAEVATASEKMRTLEENGYVPIGYFPLGEECWRQEYYAPLQAGFDDFLGRHEGSAVAQEIIEADKKEIALYEKYHDFFSYGCYIARKSA